jgi:hypothetical protein
MIFPLNPRWDDGGLMSARWSWSFTMQNLARQRATSIFLTIVMFFIQDGTGPSTFKFAIANRGSSFVSLNRNEHIAGRFHFRRLVCRTPSESIIRLAKGPAANGGSCGMHLSSKMRSVRFRMSSKSISSSRRTFWSETMGLLAQQIHVN